MGSLPRNHETFHPCIVKVPYLCSRFGIKTSAIFPGSVARIKHQDNPPDNLTVPTPTTAGHPVSPPTQWLQYPTPFTSVTDRV